MKGVRHHLVSNDSDEYGKFIVVVVDVDVVVIGDV